MSDCLATTGEHAQAVFALVTGVVVSRDVLVQLIIQQGQTGGALTQKPHQTLFPLWSNLKFSFIQTCVVPEFVMGYSISAPLWDQRAPLYVAHASGGCLRAGDLETTCVGTQETLLGGSRPAAKQTALQLLTAQCSHSPQ